MNKKKVINWIVTVAFIAYIISPFDLLPMNLTDDVIATLMFGAYRFMNGRIAND